MFTALLFFTNSHSTSNALKKQDDCWEVRADNQIYNYFHVLTVNVTCSVRRLIMSCFTQSYPCFHAPRFPAAIPTLRRNLSIFSSNSLCYFELCYLLKLTQAE